MGHLLAGALLLSVVAQAPSADRAGGQLNGPDVQTMAWGAYHAGAYQRVEAIPRLKQLLEVLPPAGPLEERAFIQVVMDALIQLHARVPARLLVPYLEKHPAQTLVLLSQAEDRDVVLLELLPQLSGVQWFAAANMLLESRAPGLVEHLATTVRLRIMVHVTDTEHVGYVSGGVAGAGIACGIGHSPAGFPPHAEYRLHGGPSVGLVVLATGPHSIYYARTVTSNIQYQVSESLGAGPTDDDRVDYLRAMWPDPSGSPFRAHMDETVLWTTAEGLSRRVGELRGMAVRRFAALVERAAASRNVSVRPRAPEIELHIVDRRGDQRVPLPAFER